MVPGFYNARNLQVSRLPSVVAPAAVAVFTDAQFGKELEVLKYGTGAVPTLSLEVTLSQIGIKRTPETTQ